VLLVWIAVLQFTQKRSTHNGVTNPFEQLLFCGLLVLFGCLWPGFRSVTLDRVGWLVSFHDKHGGPFIAFTVRQFLFLCGGVGLVILTVKLV
jgi:hypothetical protein